MAMWLKQSTAGTVKIGPFIDPTTGDAETSLTISQADVRLSKNGGNMAQKSDSSSCTHDEIGIYDCPLNTTDTGTLGRLQVYIHESGALPVWHDFMVVPANVWDSMFGEDKLEVEMAGADIRAAIGMAAANFDDQMALLPLGDDIVDVGDILGARNAEIIDGSITRAQAERITLAVVAGLTADADDGTPKFFGQDDTTVRVSAVIVDGNRVTVTLDGD